jgi:hypothetical protein
VVGVVSGGVALVVVMGLGLGLVAHAVCYEGCFGAAVVVVVEGGGGEAV